MPKVKRKPEEIEAVRLKILDEALIIIADDGFDNLSMRKLAGRLGIAAKTIYNYYSSKEEIYIMVLTRGFEIMIIEAEETAAGYSDPIEKLKGLCRAYVDFGINNHNYYNIMFNLDVPKYTDYVDTPLESAALIEKKTALKLAEFGRKVIAEISQKYGTVSEEDIEFTLLKLWSSLHGIVSLFNSRVMHEVSDHAVETLQRITDEAITPFLP